MVPVFPYQIRRSEDGQGGELLLRLARARSAFIVHLSLDQARTLAVEMRGLASDHCVHHHLTCSVLQSLRAGISSVVLKGLDEGLVIGALRLETEAGPVDVEADVAAALGIAIHLGLPIYMEGSWGRAEPEDEPVATPEPVDSLSETQMPEAFLELIEGLDFPSESVG